MPCITLNRKGWVETEMATDNQCKDVNWGRYSYEVKIKCDENNTDEREFIIDNSVIHSAIVDCFKNFMSSCEGMVKKVAEILLEKCKEHGTKVLDMHIVIKPRGVDDHSYAWFEWSMN